MKNHISIPYDHFDSWRELSESDQVLVQKAYQIAETAYAPYSEFHVGSVVELMSGELVLGSNQENIAFPSGLCAERVALFYTGANFPQEVIKTLCVVAKGELLPVDKLLTPCGACRQVMLETEIRQNQTYRIMLISQNEQTVIFYSAKDLLPFAFGAV
jgi:cytidine deaminase